MDINNILPCTPILSVVRLDHINLIEQVGSSGNVSDLISGDMLSSPGQDIGYPE
jgi:hypothetical protein